MTTAAERETRGTRTMSRRYHTSIQGFMDDRAVTTTKRVHARWDISANVSR